MKKQIISKAIKQLDYDFKQFDLLHFINHVQRRRRREIILLPADFEHELSALWIRAETADYIFYNQSHHVVHQKHSILHEIAHITLNHPCVPIQDILPQSLLAELNDMKQIGLARMAGDKLRDSPTEQEAEAFVYAVQELVMNANRMDQLIGQGSSIAVLNEYVEGMAFDL